MPPVLTLQRKAHSVHPWRIGLLHAGGRFQAIPHLTFPRRRDAAVVLTALQALDIDWSAHPATWTTEVWEAVSAVQEAAPGWQVHRRGLRTWDDT